MYDTRINHFKKNYKIIKKYQMILIICPNRQFFELVQKYDDENLYDDKVNQILKMESS